MKQKNHGFTLVELLGVLVVLAVTALITTPIVTTYIEESRYSAFKSGIQDLTRSMRYENGNVEYRGVSYTFPLEEGVELGIKGDISNWVGTSSIDENGNISLSIRSGQFCASKNIEDKNITYQKNC